MNEMDRVARLAAELRALEVDQLLVSAPAGVRYLTGYSGSNGLATIAAHERTPHRFFTDFRYATQAAEQVPGGFVREIAPAALLEAVARALGADGEENGGGGGGGGGGKLGFDDATLTVGEHARLRELLADQSSAMGTPGWELVRCAGAVERLRAIKDEWEIERVRAAAELADRALTEVLEGGLAGRAEREIAIELELRMRRLGARAPSFPSIVASGAHGALPHAEPRDVEIPRGVLVTIDWGAELDGYCSDCTRTYATGPLDAEATEVYELVLSAQEAALAAVRAGVGTRELDAVARSIIEQGGHAERFGHGLGHGVGIEVHEAPRLSRTAADEPLRAGNVVTVEPGVYLPGRFGVRIEDLVVVGEHGHERFTRLPKELTVVE